RTRDVFELLFADVLAGKINAPADLLVNFARDTDAAVLCDALQPGSHVDAVAVNADFIVDHVADIDADSESHPAIWLNGGIALGRCSIRVSAIQLTSGTIGPAYGRVQHA